MARPEAQSFMPKVLVACEFSGRVRDAFLRRGWEALSCDLLPSDSPGPHYCGDVKDLLGESWDMMIAFPPCTYLCCSGNRWHHGTERRREALDFVQNLLDADIPRIALENPVGVISSQIRKPDQIIHPWQFGHGETKTTCLWLKNLPTLEPTKIVSERKNRVHKMPESKDRWRMRSLTYQGIADAMAEQWKQLDR
jgi:hypothetical protein